VPVNDLDSVGTVATFSATLIWLGLPRQGVYLRKQEVADYVALWRWMAHVLGAPAEWFESPERARGIMESLMLSELHPSETSRVLANNILTGMSGQPPTYASREFLAAEAYWLNGAKLSSELAIERPRLYYSALVLGQCIFLAAMSYTYRSIPSWDAARNKVNKTQPLAYPNPPFPLVVCAS